MGNSATDFVAISLGAFVALVVAAVLVWAHRGDNHRRAWIAAAALFAGLFVVGAIDLIRSRPRETNFSVVAIGVGLTVLGTLAMVRATHRSRAWVRWLLAYVTAVLLLFGGLLLGAMAARWLPV